MNLSEFHSELTELLVLTSKTKAVLMEAKSLSGSAESKYRLNCYDYINRMFSVFESTHGSIDESYQVLIRLIGDEITPTVMSSISKLEVMHKRLQETPSANSVSERFQCATSAMNNEEAELAAHLCKISWINASENAGHIQLLIELEATQEEIDNLTPGLFNRMINGRNQKVFTAASALKTIWKDESSPFISDESDTFCLETTVSLTDSHSSIAKTHAENIESHEAEIRQLAKTIRTERDLKCELAKIQNNKTVIRTKILDFMYQYSGHDCIETLLGQDVALEYIKARGYSRVIESHNAFFDSAVNEVYDCQQKIKTALSQLDTQYGVLNQHAADQECEEECTQATWRLDNLREAAKKYIDVLWLLKTYDVELSDTFSSRDVFDILTKNIADEGYAFETDKLNMYETMPNFLELDGRVINQSLSGELIEFEPAPVELLEQIKFPEEV